MAVCVRSPRVMICFIVLLSVKCYLFSWMESRSCPADEASSPPCQTSYELQHLQPASSLHLLSAAPSSRVLTPSRPRWPFPRRSPPSWAAWVLIFQSRVRTVLRMSRELSRGSVCFQTRGWTLGRLVEGRISLGGRTARKASKRRKYIKNTENRPKTTTYRAVLSAYACTVHVLVTVAACGSSPHAQCMAGFWLSASDGLVISSESLFGELGREFPGLREE